MSEDKNKDKEKSVSMLIKESRIIHVNDPIDKDSAQKAIQSLLLLDDLNNNPIKLFINSPGGEVNSGFFIYDCIKFIRSPVYIIGAGLVASAAALIYLAVEKEFRLSFPHAKYLLHQPLSGSRGVVTDLEIHAKEAEDIKALINKIVSEATGQSISKVEIDTDRDYWLNAEDAKKYGLVHKIINHKDEFPSVFPLPQDKTEDERKDSAKKSTKGSADNSKRKSSSKKKSDTSTTKTKS